MAANCARVTRSFGRKASGLTPLAIFRSASCSTSALAQRPAGSAKIGAYLTTAWMRSLFCVKVTVVLPSARKKAAGTTANRPRSGSKRTTAVCSTWRPSIVHARVTGFENRLISVALPPADASP